MSKPKRRNQVGLLSSDRLRADLAETAGRRIQQQRVTTPPQYSVRTSR